jgi:hypothetical protein
MYLYYTISQGLLIAQDRLLDPFFVQSHVKSSGTTVKTHQKCHFPRSHNFNSSTALDIRIADIKVLS